MARTPTSTSTAALLLVSCFGLGLGLGLSEGASRNVPGLYPPRAPEAGISPNSQRTKDLIDGVAQSVAAPFRKTAENVKKTLSGKVHEVGEKVTDVKKKAANAWHNSETYKKAQANRQKKAEAKKQAPDVVGEVADDVKDAVDGLDSDFAHDFGEIEAGIDAAAGHVKDFVDHAIDESGLENAVDHAADVLEHAIDETSKTASRKHKPNKASAN